jgi:hypothetical protein
MSLDTARMSACATVLLLWLTCGAVWAQSGITQPQMGVIIDGLERARPVFGVSASVTLGNSVASAAVSAACSDSLCVLKTWDAIVAGGFRTKAPPGPALIAIDGQTALVYFPRIEKLARWQGDTLEPLALKVSGAVVGLRSNAGAAQFAVRRNGATWIVDGEDQAIDSLPSASGPIMLTAWGAMYTDGDDVVLRRSDRSELRFSVPGARSFVAMATNYVQIRAARSSHALRIDFGQERIFQLPEPAQ